MGETEKAENSVEEVDELTPGSRGQWLVTTQGSTHVWDLDGMLYTRLPGEHSLAGAFALDGEAMPISRIGRYPRIGETSLVFFDDPSDPTREHWRQSSVVKRIERIGADGNERSGVAVRAHGGLVVVSGSAELFAINGSNTMTPGQAREAAFRMDEQGHHDTAKQLWAAASEADQQSEGTA